MRAFNELIYRYDQLASEYAKRFCRELEGKPFDRSLLQRFVTALPGGTVCDLGCGPGHVAAYVKNLGADVMGVDLSPAMVIEARRRYRSIAFRVGNMLDLKMEAGSLGGIVALYSIIHLERNMIQQAFREMHRVLRPGGRLLVSFHEGTGELHEDHVFDTQVSFDCTLFEPNEVTHAMAAAGFSVAEVTVRPPYAFEYPTQRAYILAEAARG